MTFVVRRLLLLMPVAVGVTIVVFFMIHLIPGDPARTILGIHATPQAIAILHQQWGLNRPLVSQYWLFLDRLVHGNLGQSLYLRRPGRQPHHAAALPATLWLIAYAAVLAVRDQRAAGDDRGEPQGRRPRPRSSGRSRCSASGMPPFWLGLILLIDASRSSCGCSRSAATAPGFTGHLHSMFLPSPDRRDRARARGDPQPAGQHAQRARRGLHHHGQVQGRARPPAVRPARAAQRRHPGGHRARHQHRLPDRRRR